LGFVDHLKNANPEELLLEVAFGSHLVAGDLAKSISDGTTVRVQQLLGEAYGKGWAGVNGGAWFLGLRIADDKIKFYPGIMSPGNTDTVQGKDTYFPNDTPHSNTAWMRFEVPSAVAVNYQDNNTNPPEGVRFILNCQKGDIYNSTGGIATANQFITNAADAAAFLCMVVRRYPGARINWASLATLRTLLNSTEIPDYRTLPEGVGLTGKYYQGTNFTTLAATRIDPVIEFNLSEGTPAYNITADQFSARWEGYIRPRYTETYTFVVHHDNGIRLWVNEVLLMDIWQDNGLGPWTTTAPDLSTTIALTADQFYTIRVDWNEGGGPGEIRLAWQSATETREVVPQERLYPKNEAIRKYECHSKFTQPTSLDDALKLVLQTSNAYYQDADGVLSFYSFDTQTPTFAFNETNIITETFNARPRYTQTDINNLPTRIQADGRDLDSQYLEKFSPALYYDIEAGNVGQRSGHIRIRTIDVGNTRRWQGLKILKFAARLQAQGWIVEFEGMPQTYPVLAGDLVTLTWERKGWTAKQFLVLESTDKSIDGSADERIFRLLEWLPVV